MHKLLLLSSKKFQISLAAEGGAKLKEEKAKMSIDIATTQCPEGTVVLKCPGSQGGFFSPGHTRICDYIIFIPLGQKTKVVFVELKSTLNDESVGHAKEQLFQTTPLLSYIYSGLQVYYDVSEIPIEKHYILFFKENKMRFYKEYTRHDDGRELLSVEKRDITIMLSPSPREISVGKIIKICESKHLSA